jgi:hypothetical protein
LVEVVTPAEPSGANVTPPSHVSVSPTLAARAAVTAQPAAAPTTFDSSVAVLLDEVFAAGAVADITPPTQSPASDARPDWALIVSAPADRSLAGHVSLAHPSEDAAVGEPLAIPPRAAPAPSDRSAEPPTPDTPNNPVSPPDVAAPQPQQAGLLAATASLARSAADSVFAALAEHDSDAGALPRWLGLGAWASAAALAYLAVRQRRQDRPEVALVREGPR